MVSDALICGNEENVTGSLIFPLHEIGNSICYTKGSKIVKVEQQSRSVSIRFQNTEMLGLTVLRPPAAHYRGEIITSRERFNRYQLVRAYGHLESVRECSAFC